MKELLPLSAYEESARDGSGRTAVVMSLLWGIPMTAYLVYARGSLSLGFVLTLGIGGALVFGFGWTLWMRTGVVKMMRRLYGADPSLFRALPVEFDARLPASLMSGPIAVGGLLLLSRSLARFVPHARNLQRHQTPTQMQIDQATEIRIIERPPTLVGSLFRPGNIRLVELRNRQEAMVVLVPTPERALENIRGYIESTSARRTV